MEPGSLLRSASPGRPLTNQRSMGHLFRRSNQRPKLPFRVGAPLFGSTDRGGEGFDCSAHSKGVRFYCSTLSPNGGRTELVWSEAAERIRQQINDFYRNPSSPCDGVIDSDRALRDPTRLTRFRSRYDSGDHLHPNDAGMAAIADEIDLWLFQDASGSQRKNPSR